MTKGCPVPAYEIDGVVPVVRPNAFVHPTAVLIGDVIVEGECYIGPSASLRGDFGRIVVGRGSNVQDGCVLHAFPGRDLTLEPESHVGHGAILHGCTIRPRALIGMNAVVMDGAVVGHDALVAANSFVPAGTHVEPRWLVAGSPIAPVRELDEETIAWKGNGLRVYQELAARSLASLRPVSPATSVPVNRSRVSTTAEVAQPLHEHRDDR